MNVIVLLCDTFRRDHLGAYGGDAHTPNLDRLAAESVVFDQAFSGSFPTLPCRAEIFTGRIVFPYLDWGPLPRRYPLLAEVFARNYTTTTLITDNLQLAKAGYDYDRGFHSRIRIRGQGYDPLMPPDTPAELPCPPEKLKGPERMAQYVRNTSLRRTEEDYFAPQVFRRAMEWLEREHRRGRFFLWIDCFDPHEPWDPPREYLERYAPDYRGDWIIQPHYGPAHRYTPEELRFIRSAYRGEVTMVDAWIGRLLECVDALGLRENTAIVFLSDHGIYLGDRGLIGKMGGKEEKAASIDGWPTYVELSAVPMFWRVPGLAPGRRSALIHPGDIAPTLLELVGLPVPETFRTRSALRVLKGEEERLRDCAVSSWSLKHVSRRRPSVLRTEEWTLVFWRGDVEPELYHRPTDPGERVDVYREHPGVARELHARYVRFLREQETPPANLLPRLWSVPVCRTSGAWRVPAGGTAAAGAGVPRAGER